MKMKNLLILLISLGLFLVAGLTLQCGRPGNQENDSPKKQEGKANKSENKNKKAKHKENDKEKKPGKEDDEKKEETESVPVQVIKPSIGDISSFLLFSSNIDSEKVVDVYPMTSGIIEAIHFDEGLHVNKNDILAVLDDREASINEKKANINYEKLKAEFQRQKEIFERKMLSKEEFEKLKFNLETAKLEWQQAKLLLSYTRITSPISGVVTKRHVKVGNKINTSQLVFSVVQDKEKIAVVNIPEQEKDAIFLKQSAIIFSGSKEVTGSVKRVSPAIDPESGTFKVTMEVNDQKGIFSIGQFVNVKIIKKVHKNVVLLTKDALVFEGGKVFVFVVNKENEAEKKQIKLGFENTSQVEVVQGLEESEQVVTAGKNSLKNKTLVRIIESITT